MATYLDKADLVAEHVRDVLGQGAADRDDILPYAREHDRIIVTSDVNDFGALPTEAHAGIILLYDDSIRGPDVDYFPFGGTEAWGHLVRMLFWAPQSSRT